MERTGLHIRRRFSLTPAISQGERENVCVCHSLINKHISFPLLPLGEGPG